MSTRSWSLALPIAVLMGWIAGTPHQEPGPDTDRAAYRASLLKLLDAHNRERTDEGLEPLAWDETLHEAAQAHARDMAERQQMSHEGSDGSEPAERVKRAGYKYLRTGENVAAGQQTVAEVMSGWMNSPGHRKNILGEFTEMGAARVVGEDGVPYWAVNFGAPIPRLDPDAAVHQMTEAINAARHELGKPPLEVEQHLTSAAQEAAKSLATAEDKKLPGGAQALFDRLKDAGYNARSLQVSIASGHTDPAKAVAGMVDESSNQGIGGSFQHVGIGVSADPDGLPVWVVVLATPQ